MQNNVKATLLALLSSALTLLLLLTAYFLTLSEPPHVTELPKIKATDIAFAENDGARYVGSGFEITEYTAQVEKGKKAKITVSADTESELDISVYYASGKSEAAVFSKKLASKGVDAVWEWTIPKNSSSDKIRVVIRSATAYATLSIDVI